MDPGLVTIDGSHGEGGGQVVRTSVGLAAVLGVPVRIDNIRAGRRSPGLAAQHLTAVRLAGRICAARISGDELGAATLTFVPGSRPRAGDYRVDVADARRGGSAGAVTLVLQTALVPLAEADGPSRLDLSGGTHVAWSPPAHFLTRAFLPTVARIGLEADTEVVRWGWYPVGGGRMRATVQPRAATPPEPFAVEAAGRIVRVTGLSASSNLPGHVVQRQAGRARHLLARAGLEARIEELPGAPTSSPAGKGSLVLLVAECEHTVAAFSALGAIGKPAEKVAEEAVRHLRAWRRSGAALDPHLADQVIVPLALGVAPATFTTSEVTRHLLTNAWVVEQFGIARITVEGREGEPGRVQIVPRDA